MVNILDWIFEGIVTWVASITTSIMDAISGVFLDALGTNMTAMEEYFPFVTVAFEIMQYTAWALLFIITVWELFRAFGGPITEAENPWHLLVRSVIFAVLIGYARPIFNIALDIARAPYTALMDAAMTASNFTFAGIEQALVSGLSTLVSTLSVVGVILQIILMIALGWNYFKLLLEVVERYVAVGVLCYTSPLAFSMGGAKATNKVFQSWCRMIGSQMLLLVMNVWFLRAFDSSAGHFVANGGALTTGHGNIFLWLFCALAFLKTAQKFDSYLASLGLSAVQTGSGMGMELLMGMRVLSGMGGGFKSAGSVFKGAGSIAGGAAGSAGAAATGGFVSGLASMFKGNSYVRDAVVEGGARMGVGGGIGLVGRAFGGIAARGGAELTGESISSVASRPAAVSGSIAGEIANRSLKNFMPHLSGSIGAMNPGINLNGMQPVGGAQPDIGGTQPDAGKAPGFGTTLGTRPALDNSATMGAAHIDGSHPDAGAPGLGDVSLGAKPASTADAEGSSVKPADGQDYGGAEPIRAGIDIDGIPFGSAAGMTGMPLSFQDTEISGGHISTTAVTPDGKTASVDLYSAAAFEEPSTPHSVVTASDGSQWYQTASGDAMGAFFPTPSFTGDVSESAQVASVFPGADEGTSLRTVGEGVVEASHPDNGNSLWYNSAYYQEPDAPHETMRSADGVGWYAMQPHAAMPDFEPTTVGGSLSQAAMDYNTAQFQQFMPGYEQSVSQIDSSRHGDGLVEVRHADGSGTAFYDKTMYQAPRGDHKVYEDSKGGQWYAIPGTATVERRPVYENGKAVYDGENLKTVNVESIRYKTSLTPFGEVQKRDPNDRKPPNSKRR